MVELGFSGYVSIAVQWFMLQWIISMHFSWNMGGLNMVFA